MPPDDDWFPDVFPVDVFSEISNSDEDIHNESKSECLKHTETVFPFGENQQFHEFPNKHAPSEDISDTFCFPEYSGIVTEVNNLSKRNGLEADSPKDSSVFNGTLPTTEKLELECQPVEIDSIDFIRKFSSKNADGIRIFTNDALTDGKHKVVFKTYKYKKGRFTIDVDSLTRVVAGEDLKYVKFSALKISENLSNNQKLTRRSGLKSSFIRKHNFAFLGTLRILGIGDLKLFICSENIKSKPRIVRAAKPQNGTSKCQGKTDSAEKTTNLSSEKTKEAFIEAFKKYSEEHGWLFHVLVNTGRKFDFSVPASAMLDFLNFSGTDLKNFKFVINGLDLKRDEHNITANKDEFLRKCRIIRKAIPKFIVGSTDYGLYFFDSTKHAKRILVPRNLEQMFENSKVFVHGGVSAIRSIVIDNPTRRLSKMHVYLDGFEALVRGPNGVVTDRLANEATLPVEFEQLLKDSFGCIPNKNSRYHLLDSPNSPTNIALFEKIIGSLKRLTKRNWKTRCEISVPCSTSDKYSWAFLEILMNRMEFLAYSSVDVIKFTCVLNSTLIDILKRINLKLSDCKNERNDLMLMKIALEDTVAKYSISRNNRNVRLRNFIEDVFFPEDSLFYFGFLSLAIPSQFGFDIGNLRVENKSYKVEWKSMDGRLINLASSSFKITNRKEISTAMNVYRMLKSDVVYSLRDCLIALLECYYGACFRVLVTNCLINAKTIFAIGINKYTRMKGPRFSLQIDKMESLITKNNLKGFGKSKAKSLKEFLNNKLFCKIITVEDFVRHHLSGEKSKCGKYLYKNVAHMVRSHFAMEEREFIGAMSTLISALKNSNDPYEKSLYPEVVVKKTVCTNLLDRSILSRIGTANEKIDSARKTIAGCDIGFGIDQENPLGSYNNEEKGRIIEFDNLKLATKRKYTFVEDALILKYPHPSLLNLNANGGFSRRDGGKIILARKRANLRAHIVELLRNDERKKEIETAWNSCGELMEFIKMMFLAEGLNYEDVLNCGTLSDLQEVMDSKILQYKSFSGKIKGYSFEKLRSMRNSYVECAKERKLKELTFTEERINSETVESLAVPYENMDTEIFAKLLDLPTKTGIITYEKASENVKEVLTGVKCDPKTLAKRTRALSFLKFVEVPMLPGKTKMVSNLPKIDEAKKRGRKLKLRDVIDQMDMIPKKIKIDKSLKETQLVDNDVTESEFDIKRTVRKTLLENQLSSKADEFGGLISMFWGHSLNKMEKKEIYLSVAPQAQMNAWVHELYWKRVSDFIDMQGKRNGQTRDFTYFAPEIFSHPEAFEALIRKEIKMKTKVAATLHHANHYISCIFLVDSSELLIYDSLGSVESYVDVFKAKFRKLFEVAHLPEFFMNHYRIHYGPVQFTGSNDCAIYSILFWWSKLIEPVKKFDGFRLNASDIYFFRVLGDLNLCEYNSKAAKKVGRTLVDDIFILETTGELKTFGTTTAKFLSFLREGLLKPFDLDANLHDQKKVSDYSFQVFAKSINAFCRENSIDFALFPRRQLQPGVWADSSDFFVDMAEQYSAVTRAGVIFLDGKHYYAAAGKASSSDCTGMIEFYDSLYQDMSMKNFILETFSAVSEKFTSLPDYVAKGPVQPNDYDCGPYAAAFILHKIELLAIQSNCSSNDLPSSLLFASESPLSSKLVTGLRTMLGLCENYYNEYLRR